MEILEDMYFPSGKIWATLSSAKHGWFWVSGAGLVGYYYCRPGYKRTNERGKRVWLEADKGVHYWTSKQALVSFVEARAREWRRLKR